MTRNRRPDAALHMIRKTTVNVDGQKIVVPLCLANGWNVTTDWNRVTCKRCLRKKP